MFLIKKNGNNYERSLELAQMPLDIQDCFHMREQSAQFEWSFELHNLNDHLNDGILDRVYANLHRDA